MSATVRAFLAGIFIVFGAGMLAAAPYASMVMDARNGEVLHAEDADRPLHPASLTKMMTLYVVFEAIENGEISPDTQITVSRAAAAEPPSKLGLRAGQKIALRYLIRASAVRSANDAAHALADAISGSVPAFAARMNRTAKALGMTRTHFKNPHGLTQVGHVSTARDMTHLGRALFHHYPGYYHLFSRRQIDAGLQTVRNTNRALLSAYSGADGIKTGYTRAAGFNLVATANRGNERVIATVFGGRSSTWRNRRVAELLDLGFSKARSRVALALPPRPPYLGPDVAPAVRVADVSRSLRPRARTAAESPTAIVAAAIEAAVDAAENEAAAAEAAVAAASDAVRFVPPPRARPESLVVSAVAEEPVGEGSATPGSQPTAPTETADAPTDDGPRIVTRASTSGGRLWSVSLGTQPSRFAADTVLLRAALREVGLLADVPRKVIPHATGFEPEFTGLSEPDARNACARLSTTGVECSVNGP